MCDSAGHLLEGGALQWGPQRVTSLCCAVREWDQVPGVAGEGGGCSRPVHALLEQKGSFLPLCARVCAHPPTGRAQRGTPSVPVGGQGEGARGEWCPR